MSTAPRALGGNGTRFSTAADGGGEQLSAAPHALDGGDTRFSTAHHAPPTADDVVNAATDDAAQATGVVTPAEGPLPLDQPAADFMSVGGGDEEDPNHTADDILGLSRIEEEWQEMQDENDRNKNDDKNDDKNDENENDENEENLCREVPSTTAPMYAKPSPQQLRATLQRLELDMNTLSKRFNTCMHQLSILLEDPRDNQLDDAEAQLLEQKIESDMRHCERLSRGIRTPTAPAASQLHDKVAELRIAHTQRREATRQQKSEAEDIQHQLHSLRISATVTQMQLEELPTTQPKQTFNLLCNPKCDDAPPTTPIDMTDPIEQAEPDTLYVDLDITEPFYSPELSSHTEEQSKYQSTTMQLRLSSLEGKIATLTAVVDSGAAWSAIDLRSMRQYFPDTPIETTHRRFKDASNNVMAITGKATLLFNIGDLTLSASVFVFEKLGAPFLLGVNAIHRHGLTISTQRQVIYSERPEATKDSFEELTFTPEQRPPSEHIACSTCQTNVLNICELPSCGCHQPSGIRLECDSTTCKLYVVKEDGPRAEFECQFDEHCSTKHVGPDDSEDMPPEWIPLYAATTLKLKKRAQGKVLKLKYAQYIEGPTRAVRVKVAPSFRDKYPAIQTAESQLFNSMNKYPFITMSNQADDHLTINRGDLVAYARPDAPLHQSPAPGDHTDNMLLQDELTRETQRLKLRVQKLMPASKKHWTCIGTTPPANLVALGLKGDIIPDLAKQLQFPKLSAELPRKVAEQEEITDAEWLEWTRGEPLAVGDYVLGGDNQYYQPSLELPFEEGGRPLTESDLLSLGLDLSKSIDPEGAKDSQGNYPPLSPAKKQVLIDIALRYWYVWARDTRTPKLSRLIVLEIPTGDAKPVAQKPYPLPYQYLDAVRAEVQKLLDGGLIEPCISAWASPVLVRLKKDSTPDAIKLKLICDYRLVNSVTVNHEASLGDQDEILDGFGGDQRYCGIADCAGGFYQYLIHPGSRDKSAIVLPTSMGGTTFRWIVAPYGLTRNPAGYSQGMMFALKGMDSIQLDCGRAHGGSKSWIDDISMHANSFAGFADLFQRLLERCAFASMSLKASKTFLLHQRLEVLGYDVTPDGLKMREEKLEGFIQRNEQGKLVGPTDVEEIRKFLGAVQFYRRFIPRLQLLAAPMNAMLKKLKPGDPRQRKGTPEHTKAWYDVQVAYEVILKFLVSSAVVSAPDLRDPLAEYVLVTDACDIAAGGALLQWQWPFPGPSKGPPPGTPLRGGPGTDPINQSWRIEAGWRLRTIGYYSKTFDNAQQNYATFDKEAAAILLCSRKWAKLITCRPTTVYTDSSVAVSMLYKHLGPPRLQRWGMELGTFLPYLKIQYRKGELNGLADFLSRYPTFKQYVSEPDRVAHLPDEAYEEVARHDFFTHDLGPDDDCLKGWKCTLMEAKDPKLAERIWQAQIKEEFVEADREDTLELIALAREADPADRLRADQLPNVASAMQAGSPHVHLPPMIAALKEHVTRSNFWQEQEHFENHCSAMEKYVAVFTATYGREPVLYDLYCGEGGYSRGAREAGLQCYGFDNDEKRRRRYETEPAGPNLSNTTYSSGMKFICADVESQAFWTELEKGPKGEYGHLPPPDIIHGSPPCQPYSKLTKAREGTTQSPDHSSLNVNVVPRLIARLNGLAMAWESDGRHLIWQVESVPESKKFVDPTIPQVLLCGTMMGHHVFRHRVFYNNYDAQVDLPHDHTGKHLGARGVRGFDWHNGDKYTCMPDPNMYGVYSRPYAARGSADEWHAALGVPAHTYSVHGLSQALPIGYGRLLSCQMIARALERTLDIPYYSPSDMSPTAHAALDKWASIGYQPLNASLMLRPLNTPPPLAPTPTVFENDISRQWSAEEALPEQFPGLELTQPCTIVYEHIGHKRVPSLLIAPSTILQKVGAPAGLGVYALRRYRGPHEGKGPSGKGLTRRIEGELIGRYSGTEVARAPTLEQARAKAYASPGPRNYWLEILDTSSDEWVVVDGNKGAALPHLHRVNDPIGTRLAPRCTMTRTGYLRACRDIPALDFTRPLHNQVTSELSFEYGNHYWQGGGEPTHETAGLHHLLRVHTTGAEEQDPSELADDTRDDALESGPQEPGSETEDDPSHHTEPSPYIITRRDQRSDAVLRVLIDRLENKQGERSIRHLERTWCMSGGLLYHRDFTNESGHPRNQLVVPHQHRATLLAHYHYLHHRGHGPLHDQLRRSYYWPNMEDLCLTFVKTCKVCQQRASRPLQRVPTQPIDTPSAPFTVIHVDHKGPLPARKSGGKYKHVLVITCALTRFCLLLPTVSTGGEETLRLLQRHVFGVMGIPAVVVTDNGPAFANELMSASAAFYGYRHIHVLPYNAQANGSAESAVKRLKMLIDRQLRGYSEWHQMLPLIQQMLNSTVHTSLGVSPFYALFGREPNGLERLENPALYPADGCGNEYLRDLRGRLLALHKDLQAHSDKIKQARAQEENDRRYARMDKARFGVVEASTPDDPKYAWLIHGSLEQAAYTRRHGHGAPWQHKYKVLETTPFAARLEVPTSRGGAPRVNEWQLLRRLRPAHADDHSPSPDAPQLTPSGVLITSRPTPSQQVDGDVEPGPGPVEDGAYEIERISHAEKVAGKWRIWIQWKGYMDLTYEYRADLLNHVNDEVRAAIEEAVDTARIRMTAMGHTDAHDRDESDEDADVADDQGHHTLEPPPVPPTPDAPFISQRLTRNRTTRQDAVDLLMVWNAQCDHHAYQDDILSNYDHTLTPWRTAVAT